MGTHPIFESDFDCLTDHQSEIVKKMIFSILTTSIAFGALLLILNLFFNLRKTDNPKPIKIEDEIKLKTKPKSEPNSKTKKKTQIEKNRKIKGGDNFKHSHLITNLKGHIKSSSSGKFSNNKKYMISCDGEHSIFLWVTKDFNRGNTCVRINTEFNEVSSVSISPDSKAIIASLQRTNSSRIYKIGKKETGSGPNLGLNFVTEIVDLHPESALIKAEIKVQLQHGIQSGAFIFHQYQDTTVVITDLKGFELHRMKCQGGKNSEIEV